ncbi:restriction endonuclease subunit S [Ligilactobacillus salivarius]|uniref:restriction endonuclease subunit S n=2 Tax=Ligilactobacillus salivarius TaxID=1624 RepID=UPI0033146381
MAKEEKKAPKLRFNGYTNDWERKELNNILKINSGRDYKQLNSGSIPVYGTGGYMLSVNDKLSDTDAVGIGRKGTIDKPLYLKAPFWTVDTLFYCISKESSDVKFIYLLFQIINWKRYDESTGVPSLSKNTISSIKTYVPKVKEQDHISKLFFSLDNTLQLHERKCEELTLIKKALLQKLFPKKDVIKPEVRYKNFSDAWEQRKLGEILKERKERSSIGELISVTINNGVVKADSLERKDNSSSDKSNYKVVCKGDIAYNSMRMWQGASGYSPYNGILSPAYTVLIPTEKVDSKFISYMFKKEKMLQQFQKYSQGLTSDTWNLKYPMLKDIPVLFPKIDEQISIRKHLDNISSLIALHQRKLEKLKQLKKFLLQNMFI